MRAFRQLRISAILAGKLVFTTAGTAFLVSTAAANDFTAEKVMKDMNSEQRASYIAGVVEGLATARYMNDGKSKEGMSCIYAWLYEDKQTINTLYEAFDKYPSYPPGAIMDVLTKQKCGE